MDLARILVIADREDTRQLALRAALDLGGQEGATITLAGFVHDVLADQPQLVTAAESVRLQRALVRDKQDWLSAAVRRIDCGRSTVNIRVAWARDVAGWVNEHVTAKEFGLIVKAGHRSESFLYTPTDWRLLREAPLPVLIAHERFKRRGGKVLATVDLAADEPRQRSLNRRVVAAAAQVARRLAAAVHVVYAIPYSKVSRELDVLDAQALEKRGRARFAGEITALAEEFAVPRGHFLIKVGPPERIIDKQARKLRAALVVMGTSGRSGIAGRLLGNTAEAVIHRNHTSVLALRPEH